MTEIQRIVLVTIFTAVLITIVTSILVMTQAVYMIQIMMNVLPSRNLDTLIALSIVVALAYVANVVLDYLRSRIVDAAVLRIEARVNHRVVSDYLTGSDAEAMNIATLKDITFFRQVALSRVANSVFEVVLVPFILAVLFMVSVTLGLVFLTGLAVYVAIVIVQEVATRSARPVLGEIGGQANQYLNREISRSHSAPGTQLHGAFARRYLDASRRLMDALVPSRRVEGIFGAFKMFSRLVLQSLILGFGAYLAINERIDIGIVIGLSILSARALSPIDGLVGGWSSLLEAKAAVSRLGESLKKRNSAKPKLSLPRPSGKLTVEGICYEPETAAQPILNQISFTVEPGETLAIIGATTAGKSTLLKILSGELAPTDGTIRLDGNEMRNWSRAELELYTGYMPQEATLVDGSVAETIARFDPNMDPKVVVQAAASAAMHEIILGYPEGYNTRIGPQGLPLAAGHRQLIALARALYRRPAVLFLDEPNANLDGEGDRRLSAVLAEQKKRGTTVVLVTQRPSILELADRVLVLNKGEIQTIGAPGEVVNLKNRRIQSA
ncbi:ATP-binding cassette domain-containing protein [Labrenzia sp. CE80]|uniref:type I secretion system permease/ATPase n=1 Tax=Labrenzia sp. CE80 TaxID=1788986 RepID=UPI00129B6845|nr:ATP-binding cassette domain-containing protein [Labrenzia sp. CE80]